jgi:hypothetical protein
MIEFIFKRSNFNSYGSITSRHVTTMHRPQRQTIMQTVPLNATVRSNSSVDGTVRPEQTSATPSDPAATSSRTTVAPGDRTVVPTHHPPLEHVVPFFFEITSSTGSSAAAVVAPPLRKADRHDRGFSPSPR